MEAIVKRLSTALAVLAFVGMGAIPSYAQSSVKLRATGLVSFGPGATSPFSFSGEGSHLGTCEGRGEVTFEPGDAPDSLIGTGVTDIVAANGDHIVGLVTWMMNGDGKGQIMIVWQDSVEFSDGSTAYSTGRFAKSRPPGVLTTIDTSKPPPPPHIPIIIPIAILIG